MNLDGQHLRQVEDDEERVPRRRPRGKRGSGAELDVDVEEDEIAEWKKELGSKGRKPVGERRRPRRGEDDEDL